MTYLVGFEANRKVYVEIHAVVDMEKLVARLRMYAGRFGPYEVRAERPGLDPAPRGGKLERAVRGAVHTVSQGN